jgi:hypothetical protein
MQQGHHQQAHSMLKKIYEWFTEGFDTADLKRGQGAVGTARGEVVMVKKT